MACPVVHFELLSKNPEKLSDFYTKTFGWKITHRPELNYRIVETGGEGGIQGGIIKPDKPEPWPGNTTVYINVEDLAAYAKKIAAAGGRILIEKQEVPNMGWFTLFLDPEGRMMGLWKSKT